MEKTIITEKEYQAIKTYLSSRLGAFGILDYEFEYEETPKHKQARITQTIKNKTLGIFQFALSECVLNVTIWSLDKKEGQVNQVNLCDVGLSYSHIDGGSNGCKTNIKFYSDNDGKITEKY